jgi:Glyoxalase-like domain
MAELDHLVLGAETLEAGAAYVEHRLGVRPTPGGTHEGFGTHNLLVGLGPGRYLEIIAADPAQAGTTPARLFGLGDPGTRTMLAAGPRLVGWVARTVALDAVVGRLGHKAGEIRGMRRGDLQWRMANPPREEAMDGLVPSLIEWRGGSAAERIPDSGCRLAALQAEHPSIDALRSALAERGLDTAEEERETLLLLKPGPHPRLVARLRRADGAEVALS